MSNMPKENLPPIIQDLIYAEEYKLLDDPVGRAIKRVHRAGVADDFSISLIQSRVSRHKINQAFAGLFTIPKMSRGDLILGHDKNGNEIRIPSQYLNEPSLTVASTGSAKTARSKFMILQQADKVKGMWLFDLRKREFAILKPYLKRLNIDLIIIPGRKLRLNPLQVPEHTDPGDYAPNISETLTRILKLPARATKLSHSTILQLYRKFGILEGSQKYPTLFDLRESVARNKDANPQARQALVDSLDPLLLSLRDVLCYRLGWSTGELAKRHIVFELGGLAEQDKDLLLNTLFIGEFSSRISKGISNPKMDLLIYCDEAAKLVGQEDSSISDMIKLIRGTGIGLDLSVQSAQVASSILSNAPNRFLGRCTNSADYKIVGASMGLTQEQCRWLSINLVPGLFLGHVGQGSWRLPFLFRVPKLKI